LYYYQIIQWIIHFGEILLIDPNKYFPQSIKLIIDILTNLKGLADYHQLGQFHKLFWNYKYATAMELCLNEIFNESFNFEKIIKQLPSYIKITRHQQREQQLQQQQQQQLQQQQQKNEEKKEFNRRVSELCNDGYRPVFYQKDSNNCMLQMQDSCIGCKEITFEEKMQEKIGNFADSLKKGLSQGVQAITPRITTQNQVLSTGHESFDRFKKVVSSPLGEIGSQIGSLVDSTGKIFGALTPRNKDPVYSTGSPHTWSNQYWLNPTPKGRSRL